MPPHLIRLLVVVLPALLPGAAPGADGPTRTRSLLEARFDELDRDHDGRLSRAEAGSTRWFERVDRNHDGIVTRDEIRAALELLGGSGTAGISAETGPPVAAAAVGRDDPDSPRAGPRPRRAADAGVGRWVPDLAFTDLAGRTGRLSDYAGAKALVIALTGTSCPLAKKFAPSLARIEQEFAGKGVTFLFVNPTATDAEDEMRAQIKGLGLRGRYVHDRDGGMARGLGALSTTEIFILDAARTVVYRGAIDDQYGLGYALEAPRQRYLREALAAVVAGRAPEIAATDAPGCVLEAASGQLAAAPPPASLTYHNRISRIVQQNCLECHRSGGVGPFSLATYEDVRAHAGMMRRQVARGAMPPWFAAPDGPGESSHWKNDRSLTSGDKADLLAWLGSGQPEGDPADAPLPRAFPEGWEIGRPDHVLRLPVAVRVPAEGIMPYQVFRVETSFAEDKWIQAYELRPTARDVVHHVIVKVRPRGAAERGPGDVAAEREGFFAAYVPGNSHAVFPPGFAKKIPAGATLSVQMHYTPSGKATVDQTELGLRFSPEPPRHVIHVLGLANPRLRIPPGADNHAETASLTLPVEAVVLGLMPHLHVRGKAARFEVVLPGGGRERLLDVPHYDFNWQLPYQFAEPRLLPRGSRLIYTAWYDNSARNPANPDPSKMVKWGPQTFDEMMLGYVEYYLPGQKPEATMGEGARRRSGVGGSSGG